MSDCLIACVFRHPDIQTIRHPDIQTSRHPDIQTSRHRCSRCPERNVQIWKISFAIQCDLGHPRAPPESQKNTACPVILDSGGARGAQKKARMTRISSKYVRPFLDIPIKNLIDFGLKSQKSGSFFQNVLDIWLENDHFQEKIQNFKDFSTFR